MRNITFVTDPNKTKPENDYFVGKKTCFAFCSNPNEHEWREIIVREVRLEIIEGMERYGHPVWFFGDNRVLVIKRRHEMVSKLVKNTPDSITFTHEGVVYTPSVIVDNVPVMEVWDSFEKSTLVKK